MNAVSIKPRILPRDVIDILIGLPHGLLFGGIIPLLAAWGVGIVLWYFGLRLSAVASAFAVYLSFVVLVLCWTVRKLVLEPDGIRFVRVVGIPKFIPWSDVLEVAPAPRGEVVRLGWLTFPFAEASPALTAKGHYRLRCRSGVQYFPPSNANEFEEAVRRYREAAQQGDEADER